MLWLLIAAEAAKVDCAAAVTTRDMVECTGRNYTAAEARMTQKLSIALARAKALDRDRHRPELVGPDRQNALLAAQRSWLAYREAQCRMDSYRYRDGSLEKVELNGCFARMTADRARYLDELAADIGGE